MKAESMAPDKVDEGQHCIELFRSRVLDPDTWVSTAMGLMEAAKQLEPEVQTFLAPTGKARPCTNSWRLWKDEIVAVYFMLMSYAIENLLKAHITKKYIKTLKIAVDDKLPKLLKGHDLYKLAKRAGKCCLALGYEDILRRLTRSAVWYGRYPTPTKANELQQFCASVPGKDLSKWAQKELKDRPPISLTHYESSDIDEINRVIAELKPPNPFSWGQCGDIK